MSLDYYSMKIGWKSLKEAGARRWLILGLIMDAVGLSGCLILLSLKQVEFAAGVLLGMGGISVGLAIVALTELRAYEIKMTLRRIDAAVSESKHGQ
jgi:hypothetical protein